MDLNNDKHLDFSEFSKVLMGSLRAEFRVRALFIFYAYDEGQKGLSFCHPIFYSIDEFQSRKTGYFGKDDVTRILTLCNKCADSAGKRTRSEKRVSVDKCWCLQCVSTSTDANHIQITC
jgi:hypothetical protein